MMGSANVLLIIFFTSLYYDFAVCSDSRCRETEWKALMDFKGGLVFKGIPVFNVIRVYENQLLSWTGRDCCSWEGITCHNLTGFVQMIDLNYLGGQITPSLLNLEHLERLDLSSNNFSGIRIPAFLGSLRNLQYLDLRSAGFSGEIPQHLGNLSNLQHLDIGGKPLEKEFSSRSLSWITGLSSLTSLKLSNVDLSESLDWLDSVNMLSSLRSLTISYCGLVGLPLSRDLNLTSLVMIDLIDNSFDSALPTSFFNLSNLGFIRITDSDLRGPIPDMFHKLPLLKWLDLSSNSFRSSLPDSLCALDLTYLDLSGSQLQGSIPSCLGNLTNLMGLLLDDNQLSGEIPTTLGKLAKLGLLGISSNSLVGELSESFFEGLISLRNLDISRNNLIFNVSSHWIPHFQTLRMDSVFVGVRTQFPAWLQTQTNLTSLSLRNASISGAIPDWCQTSYPRLSSFDLSSNFLTGVIPTFDPNATIFHLALSNNEFTGNIPSELCDLRSLSILKLDSNQLTGRIPSCLGNLRKLVVLDLANNSLFGHIPYELGFTNQLIFLRLNGNKISGELPSSLQNLTKLQTFDLGKNELQGFIPSWIGKEFVNLKHLMLHSNNFSGEISVNLCQLPSLQILNLPDNTLVGTIPPCLGNLSKMLSSDSYVDLLYLYDDTLLAVIIKGNELEYSSNLKYAKFISLSGNHLHGEIPNELMDLTELQSLNLSNNELTGKIPERIGNMNHLESLDLSRNKLYGTIPQSLVTNDVLSYLKLSFNNLSGRIPSGGHFDTLNGPLVYEGNGELCGKPTTKRCDREDLVPSKQSGLAASDDDSEFEIPWVYAGIGPGFAVGFLGVIFLLYFKSLWRYRLFRFVENMCTRF